MPNIATKFYTSTMTGAPTVAATWGDMIGLLDAVLINGFNTKTITSLTRSGSTCTATATSHGYILDQVIVISGANETEYNTEARVTAVTTNTFTFTITGTPSTPATGTISCKVAPLNWTTVFTASGQRVYRSNNSNSAKNCLRVDDYQPSNYTAGYAKMARVGMAQSFSDINTPLGAQAPLDITNANKNWATSGTGSAAYNGWYKWYYARYVTTGTGSAQGDYLSPDTNTRQWVVTGDDRGFYVFMSSNGAGNSYGMVCNAFTDVVSYKTGDIFNTALIATDHYLPASSAYEYTVNHVQRGHNFTDVNSSMGSTLGKLLLRDHTGIGIPVGFSALTVQTTLTTNLSTGYSTGINWPNAVDYSLLIHPWYIRQSDSNIRGYLPGVYWVLNNMSSGGYSDLQILDTIASYPGRKFINLKLMTATTGNPYSNVLVDITGPWWS